MKTILVFKAQDILMRDAILNKLTEHGIACFGADTSINVVYPNTPNLYFGGASALFEGYRILVAEENVERAKTLIEELISSFEALPKGKLKLATKENPADYYPRLFYITALASFFIPSVLIPFSIYNFVKAVRNKEHLQLQKVILSFVFLGLSAVWTYLLLKYGNLISY